MWLAISSIENIGNLKWWLWIIIVQLLTFIDFYFLLSTVRPNWCAWSDLYMHDQVTFITTFLYKLHTCCSKFWWLDAKIIVPKSIKVDSVHHLTAHWGRCVVFASKTSVDSSIAMHENRGKIRPSYVLVRKFTLFFLKETLNTFSYYNLMGKLAYDYAPVGLKKLLRTYRP